MDSRSTQEVSFGDRAPTDLVIVVNSLLAITSTISFATRFYRPGSKEKKFDVQSVMLLLATTCGVVMSILQCIASSYGLGKHITDLSSSNLRIFLKMYPAIMALYFACNMFVKFGLLLFYLRTTFERKHLYAIWVMMIIALGFGVSSILVVVFQCQPLDKIWNFMKPGHCIDIISFFYANASIMIANDVIMYIMPIVFTWNLQLRRPQRIVLNLLFALGALVVATSVFRLLALIRFAHAQGDLSFHLESILLWSAIENHVAIFIACAPSIKTLVVGTLIPIVSSGLSSVREKVKNSRGSQSSSPGNTDRRGSDNAENQLSVGRMQQGLANKVINRLSTIDSELFSFGATRGYRLDSATSTEGLNSDITIDKSYTVSVFQMDDLEAQQLPQYKYDPEASDRK